MDKVTLQNIETLLSDKLQNYMADSLKAISKAMRPEVSKEVTMEKTDFGKREGKTGSDNANQGKAHKKVAANLEASSVLRGKDQGRVYEHLLKDGKKTNTLRKEMLLSILEEVKTLVKKQETKPPPSIQAQIMPGEKREIEDRKDINFKEEEELEEEYQDDEMFEEEEGEGDGDGDPSTDSTSSPQAGSGQGEEDDGSITLKDYCKTLYLKD